MIAHCAVAAGIKRVTDGMMKQSGELHRQKLEQSAITLFGAIENECAEENEKRVNIEWRLYKLTMYNVNY